MSIENFAKYAKRDEKISAEATQEGPIRQKLIELNDLFMDRFAPIGTNVLGENVERSFKEGLDSRGTKEWLRTFVGHPERIEWLNKFVEDTKKKLEEALPDGDISILKDRERWIAFKGDKKAILAIMREAESTLINTSVEFDQQDEQEKEIAV